MVSLISRKSRRMLPVLTVERNWTTVLKLHWRWDRIPLSDAVENVLQAILGQPT
ncbi:hypothetical protein AALO_G00131760, partial [Alosa alosa]